MPGYPGGEPLDQSSTAYLAISSDIAARLIITPSLSLFFRLEEVGGRARDGI